MKILITLTLFSFSFISQAEMFKMAKINSELNENTIEFYIETNEDNTIESVRYLTILPNGGILEDVVFTAEEVIRDGAVISEHGGYEVVRLEVENFDLKAGGTIKLNYLHSGISGVRKFKRLSLKNNDAKFRLYDQDEVVNKMFFRVNRVPVLGIVGVKSVSTYFSPEKLRN